MAPLAVSIKHAGKTHNVQLDPDLPPKAFKEAVYQVTGVPLDRMKIMVKGGMLKDDSNWAKIGPKAGQTFMVIGTAGELPKAPEKPVVFLEDMDDEELAGAVCSRPFLFEAEAYASTPFSWKCQSDCETSSLGNTCYMNSTVQALRAIPELQVSLGVSQSGQPSTSANPSLSGLPASLRDLYAGMACTTDPVNPASFLNVLRQVNPQFAERDRSGKGATMGGGFAQQDAEECYSQVLNSLREVNVAEALIPPGTAGGTRKFIEQYLMSEVRRELSTLEAPDEPPSISTERIMKIECNITGQTNYMQSGILGALNSTLSKDSPSLGRTAEYTQTSRLTRLPSYLTVQMVRFAWKADVQKKAKIMVSIIVHSFGIPKLNIHWQRKVKFPEYYDALDIVTPELKAKLLPASRRMQEIEKERAERRKVRKRTKKAREQTTSSATPADSSASTETPAEAESSTAATATQGGELEEESVYRQREQAELEGLVDADVKNDIGASWNGLYELVAIVTHKGAAADSGHYMGFVKKSVFHRPPPRLYSGPAAQSAGTTNPSSVPTANTDSNAMDVDQPAGKKIDEYAHEDDEDWYKFDDDKVSIFPKEKLATLDGGGEDSSAYVLLYRTKAA
ncbi:ubiquitin carboxyl-terminal hydrolase 6 [Moniliophthora roreri]|nr:ubiquitin carboxyl-terminal hydrolase 6 [Moniliophthora roreri]